MFTPVSCRRWCRGADRRKAQWLLEPRFAPLSCRRRAAPALAFVQVSTTLLDGKITASSPRGRVQKLALRRATTLDRNASGDCIREGPCCAGTTSAPKDPPRTRSNCGPDPATRVVSRRLAPENRTLLTKDGPCAGRALESVRVIDLTAVLLLGPLATQHLADMGADVIAVEPPEGHLLRAAL